MKEQLQAGVLVLALAAPLAGPAQDNSARPDPSKFPAHASYQGVTIAAVPIPDTPAAERIFGPRAAPTRAGFLPVEVIIFNQRSEIIRVKVGRIKIIGFDNQFEQVDPQAVAEGLYPRPEVDRPKPSRLPVPWPRKQKVKKDKKRAQREEAEAALRSRQLRAALVAPGGYARGYLYFDLRSKSIDLAGSSLYVPGVEEEATGERLLFFEISLEPYADTKP